MSLNKVTLIGNLGKDPEVRYTASQTAVTKFTVATSERRKDKSGEWYDHTEWHQVVSFGKTAENAGKFLLKGRQVYIEGKIQTSKWEDKEGQPRYTTEIIADNIIFLSKGKSSEDRVEQTSADVDPNEQGMDDDEPAPARRAATRTTAVRGGSNTSGNRSVRGMLQDD